MTLRAALLLALAAAVAAGPPGPGEPFPQAATSPFTHVRSAAAAAPPEQLDADGLKALTALLSDRDLFVRQQAARGLGLRAAQAGERGARALVAAALDPFGGLDDHAAQALGEYGTSAYGPMRDQLRNPDVLAASRIWRLFRGTEKGKDLCLAFICRALTEEKDPAVRAMAALVMRHISLADRDSIGALCHWASSADAVVPALAKALLEDEDSAVRAACAASLPDSASENLDLRERAVAALEASSKEDPDEGVRNAALKALGKIPSRR